MKDRAKRELEKLRSLKVDLKTEKGEPVEIPKAGSLGLLALGATGLMAWRNVRGDITPAEKKEGAKKDEA